MAKSWLSDAEQRLRNGSARESFDAFRGMFEHRVTMRMGRGDVRAAVLRLLAEAPMHGYQIIQEIETRSKGSWKPSAGSVYPTLQLLTDEGLIESKESKGRKTYSLTDAGRTAVDAHADQPAPWDTAADAPTGPRGALGKAGFDLARAATEVARTGSPEQIEQAAAVLKDARRALHAMLSHD